MFFLLILFVVLKYIMTKEEIIKLIWASKSVVVNSDKLCKIIKPGSKYNSTPAFIFCFISVNNSCEKYYILKNDTVSIMDGRIVVKSQSGHISYFMDIFSKINFKDGEALIGNDKSCCSEGSSPNTLPFFIFSAIVIIALSCIPISIVYSVWNHMEISSEKYSTLADFQYQGKVTREALFDNEITNIEFEKIKKEEILHLDSSYIVKSLREKSHLKAKH